MIKSIEPWSVSQLRTEYIGINFPEYQREPNIWALSAKQRLIDSVMRQFDIASIYLYDNGDGTLDCIDGRQRLGALMAFAGQDTEDAHAGFPYQIKNEVFDDAEHPFERLAGLTYAEIRARAEHDETAAEFIAIFEAYEVTIVRLSGHTHPDEFDLQFIRLNIGAIINSGEKLNAMVGEMRDICFEDLGHHDFLANANLPTRRYAQEQTAAQMLAQVFEVATKNDFARTRHFDLQLFFKRHTKLGDTEREIVGNMHGLLDVLAKGFANTRVLRNRSITVSIVLLAYAEKISTVAEASDLAAFLEEFNCRLQWQVRKHRNFSPSLEFRHLLEFQRHLTQASVEKWAVRTRHQMLTEEWTFWQQNQALRGDADYQADTGLDPSTECRAALS